MNEPPKVVNIEYNIRLKQKILVANYRGPPLTQQQKTKILEGIKLELLRLGEQTLVEEVKIKKCVKERDKLNEEYKKLRIQTLELKEKRDKLSLTVKELKQKRNEMQKEASKKIEEIDVLNKKITELEKKKPKRNFTQLETIIESIEWKIQTTSLDVKEERELIDSVRHFETQLNIHRKLRDLKLMRRKLKNKTADLRTGGDTYHLELIKIANTNQETHKKMIKKIEESKEIKNEADRLHQQFLQAKEKVKPTREEIKKLKAQKRKIKQEISQKLLKEKEEREQDLRERIELQTREKLKQGKRVNWEEFQLLSQEEPEEPD